MAKAKTSPTTLQSALKELEDQFGSSSIFTIGDDRMAPDYLSSGSYALDLALGGGWSRGTIVELYGVPGGGKSGLAMSTVAQAQKEGGECFLLDVERAMNQEFATRCGVDLDKVHMSRPTFGEETFQYIEKLLRSEAFSVIVIDSIAAMTPLAEFKGDYTDATIGAHARMMGQGLRKLGSVMSETSSKTVVIFINQMRANIGGYGNQPQSTTTGGKAVPFFANTRCDVRKTTAVKRGSAENAEVIGHSVEVKIVKNRQGSPNKVAGFDIIYGDTPISGLSNESSVIDLGKKFGFIEDKSGWHTNTLTGEKFAHGRLKAIEKLRQDPAQMNALKAAITAEFKPIVGASEELA